jgi:hypothetical protein
LKRLSPDQRHIEKENWVLKDSLNAGNSSIPSAVLSELAEHHQLYNLVTVMACTQHRYMEILTLLEARQIKSEGLFQYSEEVTHSLLEVRNAFTQNTLVVKISREAMVSVRRGLQHVEIQYYDILNALAELRTPELERIGKLPHYFTVKGQRFPTESLHEDCRAMLEQKNDIESSFLLGDTSKMADAMMLDSKHEVSKTVPKKAEDDNDLIERTKLISTQTAWEEQRARDAEAKSKLTQHTQRMQAKVTLEQDKALEAEEAAKLVQHQQAEAKAKSDKETKARLAERSQHVEAKAAFDDKTQALFHKKKRDARRERRAKNLSDAKTEAKAKSVQDLAKAEAQQKIKAKKSKKLLEAEAISLAPTNPSPHVTFQNKEQGKQDLLQKIKNGSAMNDPLDKKKGKKSQNPIEEIHQQNLIFCPQKI